MDRSAAEQPTYVVTDAWFQDLEGRLLEESKLDEERSRESEEKTRAERMRARSARLRQLLQDVLDINPNFPDQVDRVRLGTMLFTLEGEKPERASLALYLSCPRCYNFTLVSRVIYSRKHCAAVVKAHRSAGRPCEDCRTHGLLFGGREVRAPGGAVSGANYSPRGGREPKRKGGAA
jgi:hypothetical protein